MQNPEMMFVGFHPLSLHPGQRRLALGLAILVTVLTLSGCAGMVVGAAATAGVAAYDERGIDGVARDTAMEAKLRANLVEQDDKFFTNVGIDVYEGRVLLTGRVDTEDLRATAVKSAWALGDAKDVINEIHVSPNPLTDIANDAWITTQLKTKMTFDSDVLAINYSIETVGGVIYLIGIAQNKTEIDRVLAHARSISYVKKVVNYVRIKEATG